MMSLLFSLSLLASAVVGSMAAEELGIDVTQGVECDRKTKTGDKISVHYRGTLQSDGSKFDASYDRGAPFSFMLGGGQVIKGWDQGLLDMCIGEKRTLTVPPGYGYGQQSMGPIPPGSTLIFETELMGIDGVPKPEAIVTKPKSAASETTEEENEANVVEKAASLVADAAAAAKTIVGDSDDDGQEHNEL